MAYITTSNSKKLVKTLNDATLYEIETSIYKKEIYFFNKKEIAILKGIREFIRDPENFRLKYYTPIVIKDSYMYVYPEKQPAYHKDDSCQRLKSNFINFYIPEEIRQRGNEAIIEFRKWFDENKHFLEEDAKNFTYKMQAKFFIKTEINPKSIELPNSGYKVFDNYSLEEVERQIDNLLKAAGSYYRENPDKQHLIRRFQKLTFLAYVYGDIYNNDSGLNDSDLKKFLKMYDEDFKIPVKELLIEYYRLLYNPDMTFSDTLLDKLGFKPCASCFNNNVIIKL